MLSHITLLFVAAFCVSKSPVLVVRWLRRRRIFNAHSSSGTHNSNRASSLRSPLPFERSFFSISMVNNTNFMMNARISGIVTNTSGESYFGEWQTSSSPLSSLPDTPAALSCVCKGRVLANTNNTVHAKMVQLLSLSSSTKIEVARHSLYSFQPLMHSPFVTFTYVLRLIQ